MRGQNPTKRQYASLSTGFAVLAAGTMVFCMVFFLPNRANAALTESDVVILYPQAGAQVLKGTDVSVEVIVNAAGSYKADLDVTSNSEKTVSSWDHTNETITSAFSGNTPIRFDPHALSLTGGGYINVLIKDGGTNASLAVQSVTVTLVDSLQFNGAMYIGATTPICKGGFNNGNSCWTDDNCKDGNNDGICGGDAPGWVSASCENTWGLNCTAPTTYTMAFAPSGSYATLQNDTWAGESENSAGSLGWVTWNKKYCSGGNATYCIGGTQNYHVSCSDETACGGTIGTTSYCQSRQGGECVNNTDCGTGGTCVSAGNTGDLPRDVDSNGTNDDEDWNASSELSHYYTAKTTVDGILRYPSQLAGWGKFLSYDANNGWVHLRGAPVTESLSDYQDCQDCSVANGTSVAKCNICGKAKVVSTGNVNNYACNSCTACTVNGTDTSCAACDVCDQYGVSFDQSQNKLVGYAWAGSEDTGGLGWIKFDQVSANVIIAAWLQTQYGDIFSGSNVRLTAPLNNKNATYLIQANGDIQAKTELASDKQEGYPTIALPTITTRYINVLGRLNFDEMLGQPPITIGTRSSRYGTTVALGSGDISSYINNTLLEKLDGSIYYYKGNATINSAVTIKDGSTATTGSGAGTVIIDGDLGINANINYDGNSGSALSNIPSVAWIVRGNVTIGPAVTNLAGVFIVLGGSGTTVSCGTSSVEGVISTGVSTQQLTVSGLAMARCFNFQRSLLDNDSPAESVVYDGRFIANPPPGLQNLAALLPTVRQVTP